MNPFKTFICKGCEAFINGTCLCYKGGNGPRKGRDCIQCRCVVITFLLNNKKNAQKNFFRCGRGENVDCGCKLICQLRSDGKVCQRRRGEKKVFIAHKTCKKYYKKCDRMKALEDNFNSFCALVEKVGSINVPEKCIPFVGTKQRQFTELREFETEYKKKRDAVVTHAKSGRQKNVERGITPVEVPISTTMLPNLTTEGSQQEELSSSSATEEIRQNSTNSSMEESASDDDDVSENNITDHTYEEEIHNSFFNILNFCGSLQHSLEVTTDIKFKHKRLSIHRIGRAMGPRNEYSTPHTWAWRRRPEGNERPSAREEVVFDLSRGRRKNICRGG